ncbi:hypothetical protein [Methylobacterium sp. CM6246]
MLKRVVIAACLIAVAGGAKAADEDKAKMMSSVLEAMGFKQSNAITNNSSCKIIVDADQAEVIKSVPVLQKMDLLNQDMSKGELMRAPTKTTFAIALQMAPIQVKILYDTEPVADKCFFLYNLISQDDYGNTKRDILFSYKFDRAIYNKINWDKFKSQSLVKVSKDFYVNPEIMSRINEE